MDHEQRPSEKLTSALDNTVSCIVRTGLCTLLGSFSELWGDNVSVGNHALLLGSLPSTREITYNDSLL